MIKTKRLTSAIHLALVAGAAFAVPVYAEPQSESDDTKKLEAVVVTGTRIQSQQVTASSPVIEIEAEEIKFSGATRIEDLVNQFPQLSPVFDSFQNNPSLGYPTVDLRGLGPNRTLTLVNGQRLPPGASELRDLSIIPSAIVQRVDVLTGGASAVYGSDAVAGVVNFILDTEFEGLSLNYGWSAYQHDNRTEAIRGPLRARGFSFPDGDSGSDGISRNASIAIGSAFADGAGHAMAWATWRQNDPLFQGQRDYSACALNDPGTVCGGSATAANPNFFIFDAANTLAPVGFLAHINAQGRWTRGIGERYNYAPINYYQRPEDRYTAGSSVRFEVNEHFRPYLEGMFVNRKSSVQIAESGTFFVDLLTISCNDPLIGNLCSELGLSTAAPIEIYVGKRNVEGGPRFTNTETNSFRIVGGAEGSITDLWSYNVSFIIGQTAADTFGFNDLLRDRISDALLGCPAGSFSGCIPYNVWRRNGVTAEAAAALAGVSANKTETKLTGMQGYVTGDLGFGFPSAGGETVSLVAGFETRRETYDFNADSNSQAGNFAGAGGPALPLSGETDVSEFFFETAVPILNDAGFIDRLNLDIGYRRSDYELSGNANTYKLGFGADISGYRVRGGYNRAIRAPNTSELFSTQQLALFNGIDPCSGATPRFTLAECQRTGVTAAQYGRITASPASQYNQFIGGNLNLRPEEADTYTIGFVANPLDALAVSVDYFDIELTDTITAIGAQTILDFCGRTGDPFLCSRVRRNPRTGDLWLGSDPATSGYVINFTDNFGERRLRGIDLGGSYRWDDLFAGTLNLSLQGTYLLEDEVSPLPGVNDSAAYDCAGRINPQCQSPEWRHIATARYSRDIFTVSLRWRHYGDMDYINTDGSPGTVDQLVVGRDRRIGSYNYLDLSGSVSLFEIATLTLGVNNLADKPPPLVGTTLALNGNSPGGYDQAGRFIFSTLSFDF